MKVILLLAVLSALVAYLVYQVLSPPTLQPISNEATWFGFGDPPVKQDTQISSFRVSIPDRAIADWRRRVEATKFGSDLENGNFEYGFQVNYMKTIQQHWLNAYDWKKHEAELNKYQHFTTSIEGIGVHFMRIHPKKPEAARGRVLLLIHGWPGSVWEFMKIIPMLTDPESFGGSAQDAFEVIAPSIPGYGFSDAAKKRGFGVTAAARIFQTLMLRLGHEQFYIQGGDWGAAITSTMAQLYPEHILGIHINMITINPSNHQQMLHQVAAYLFPSLVLSEADQKRLVPFSDMFSEFLQETGYLHIQATKPDTVALGLLDSPVGLAGYILEKFSTATNKNNRQLADGGLTASFELDDLLTNVMIYWFTETIGSSIRLYKEIFADDTYQKLDSYPIYVPAGLAQFPNEVSSMPRALVEYRFKNLLQYTDMPAGGHFAAMEQPRLLADDIFKFVKKVEMLEQFGS